MAVRRKYVADRVGSEPEPAAAAEAVSAAASEADNPFTTHLRALAAAEEQQARAAAVARQEAQLLAQHIDTLQISEHKKAFLRTHPELLHPQLAQLAGQHHQAALARGVEDDTAEMNDAILAGVHADVQRAQAATLAEQPSPAATAPPTPTAAAMPALPPRRGPPVSAPVSRGVPGGGSYGHGKVELSAAEREAARISGISDTDYARNKIRLQAEKAAGRYLEPS